MNANRIVAIDFGTARVGLAIADPLEMFAQPFGTWSPAEAIDKLVLLHREQGIGTLVIGWPLLPDGSQGEATESVDRFVARLSNVLERVDFVRWDERYTSEDARDRIRSGPEPSMGKRGRGRIDAAAAGIILEEYLERQRLAPEP